MVYGFPSYPNNRYGQYRPAQYNRPQPQYQRPSYGYNPGYGQSPGYGYNPGYGRPPGYGYNPGYPSRPPYGGGYGRPQQPFFGNIINVLNNFYQQLLNYGRPPGYPPTNPPTNPPVNPIFTPGSLAIEDVPVDAQGNVNPNFIAGMLQPQSAINTAIFDNTDPSGLSKFARVGIRMIGHDLYDGRIDGDVALRTILAPNQSGNAPFVPDIDMVREWGRRDLTDDGAINGSVYVKLIEDVWPTTDGPNIAGFTQNNFIRNGNPLFNQASTNVNSLFSPVLDPTSAEGVQAISQSTGLSQTQLLNFALWGHRILNRPEDGVTPGMNRDQVTQLIASNALIEPALPFAIDAQLAQLNPTNRAFVQSLTNNPNATSTVGIEVLNTLIQAAQGQPI